MQLQICTTILIYFRLKPLLLHINKIKVNSNVTNHSFLTTNLLQNQCFINSHKKLKNFL